MVLDAFRLMNVTAGDGENTLIATNNDTEGMADLENLAYSKTSPFESATVKSYSGWNCM
jgi:hypothetical protein